MAILVVVAGIRAFSARIRSDWDARVVQFGDEIVYGWCGLHNSKHIVFRCVDLRKQTTKLAFSLNRDIFRQIAGNLRSF